MAELQWDFPIPPPPPAGIFEEPPLPTVWNSVSSELIPLTPPLTHDLLSDGEDEEEAAIVIQKVWRGHQSRKIANHKRKAIIIIQKYYRGYKARKEYKVLLEQTRWMRDIAPPSTPKLQIIQRTKGISGRKRPTRGVKVQSKEVVETATITESSEGNETNENGGEESTPTPAQPKLVNNGMGMMIPKFDPSAVALKARGPGMLTKDRPVSISNPEMLFKLKKTSGPSTSSLTTDEAAASAPTVDFLSGLRKTTTNTAPPQQQQQPAPLSFSPAHLRKTGVGNVGLSNSTGDMPKRMSLDFSSLPLPPPPSGDSLKSSLPLPPPPAASASSFPPLPPFTPSQLPPPPSTFSKPVIPPRQNNLNSSQELPPAPISKPSIPPRSNPIAHSFTDLPPPPNNTFIQSQMPKKQQTNSFTGSHRTSLPQALSPDVLNLPPPPVFTKNITPAPPISSSVPTQLKPGWAEYTTPEGKKYYYHQLTNITTWNASDATIPFPLPTPSSTPNLPPPPPPAATVETTPPKPQLWIEHTTEDGKKYYHEKISNITTWARPPNVQIQTVEDHQKQLQNNNQQQPQQQQQKSPSQSNNKSPKQSNHHSHNDDHISREEKKRVGGILGKFLKKRPTKQELEAKNILMSEKASGSKRK